MRTVRGRAKHNTDAHMNGHHRFNQIVRRPRTAKSLSIVDGPAKKGAVVAGAKISRTKNCLAVLSAWWSDRYWLVWIVHNVASLVKNANQKLKTF